MIDVALERPTVAAVGTADIGDAANAPIARQLVACVAGEEGGVGAEARHRMNFVDADIRQPLPALVVEPVVAALRIVRDELISPGHIGVDAKDAGVLQDPALCDRCVDPAPRPLDFPLTSPSKRFV